MAAISKIRIGDILSRVERYHPTMDENLLRRAYVFAANRHQGQVRRSGEAYLIHPLSVAWTLADMELDEEAIVAGLLHDILEDTETAVAELEVEFGAEVTSLVVALTKISGFEDSLSGREATTAENFRRLLMATMDDVRVILVKLADRLHNMRTLEFLRRERQVAIASETLEIYAPIANRLGIGSIKGELEDLCFGYLHPQEAERLKKEVSERATVAERWFSKISSSLDGILGRDGIAGSVSGRVKHLYSIYQKLKRQGVDVSDVFDFLAFRIIVNSVSDCYAALGLIHQQWSPLPARIKDHIALPKPNAYQSLHTTVVGPEGHPFEIQIRTEAMHKIAELGIAAHWIYKEGDGKSAKDSRTAWLRNLLDNIDGTSPREFLASLKVDLYPEEVFCFTPGGDVFSFPLGATVLDFAFRVHSEVGNTCVGGQVNGRWVPLKTKLNNGDIVEVATSSNQKPHHDWLVFTVTNRARTKIRAWLRREEKERAVEVGRKLLERDLHRLGASLRKLSGGDDIKRVATAHGFAREDDLFAAIGFGKLAGGSVAAEIVPDTSAGSAEPEPVVARRDRHVVRKGGPAFEVSGNPDILVYVAKCCQPLPGEEIVGFVTRGKGVAVHSSTCNNVSNLLYHPEREIEVCWASDAGGEKALPSRIEVDMIFADRLGMLSAISRTISDEGSNLLSCSLDAEGQEDYGFVSVAITVRDASQLGRIISKLKNLTGMIQVDRRNAPKPGSAGSH